MQSVSTEKCHTLLLISHLLSEQKILHSFLTSQGYHVHTAITGCEGLHLLFQLRPALVMLDIELPDFSTLQLCQRIRNFSDIPIIFFVEPEAPNQAHLRTDCSWADYIEKPIQPVHLLAHVQQFLQHAVLPQTHPVPVVEPAASSDLLLDDRQYRAILDDRAVQLSALEYQLLSYLVKNAGQTLTHAQILQHIWAVTDPVRVNDLHTLVWRLRSKIEKNLKEPQYLVSHYGIGYSFT